MLTEVHGKCIHEFKSVVIHGHVTKLCHPLYAVAQPWNIPNASLATVGGKEFNESATDDITGLQLSSYILWCP